MENNRNRGNSGYTDSNPHGNTPRGGGRPYQNGNNYQRGNRNFGGRSRNFDNNGGNDRYGNNDRFGNGGNNDRYGNRNNGSYNGNNYRRGGNGNYGYNKNNGGFDNNEYRQQGYGNGSFRGRYNNPAAGEGNEEQPRQRRHFSRQGSKYTVDEQGYHHKRYWDHSDRKKQAYDNAVEREDDVIENDGKIRLNKFLANSGMCSRREADRLIKAGQVEVNGVTVTEMGVKVSIDDEVKFNGMLIKPERKRYILLNKPKDFITTLKDPSARHTVMDLIEGACKERVYPVGRLDRNTTGVLLFTNDGDLAKKLTHPSNEIQKIYHVTTDKAVSTMDLQKIADGFELEDGFINADEVGYIDGRNKCEIGIRIHSGRNRIVRRIFEFLGYDVMKLDRISFAGLDKKGLARGRWRFLTDKEIGFLFMISNKKAEVSTQTYEQDEDDGNEF